MSEDKIIGHINVAPEKQEVVETIEHTSTKISEIVSEAKVEAQMKAYDELFVKGMEKWTETRDFSPFTILKNSGSDLSTFKAWEKWEEQICFYIRCHVGFMDFTRKIEGRKSIQFFPKEGVLLQLPK